MVNPLVAETHALAPYDGPVPALPAVPAHGEPYITLMLNGMPMRFKATALRPGFEKFLGQLEASLNGQGGMPLDGKTKAIIFGLRQSVGLMIPLMRPMVKALRTDSHVPAFVSRMIPEMPVMPRHTDRVMFLLRYLSEVLHAVLTENGWALDVEPDPDASDPDALRVAGFHMVVRADELPAPTAE